MPYTISYDILKTRTKLVRKRTAHRMKLHLKYWLARKPLSPYLILTSRRSGSNFLIDCLNSVPGVSFASEILHENMYYGIRHKRITPTAVHRHILQSLNACPQAICGAKLLKYQMNALGVTAPELLALRPDMKFIVLYRRSLLDQYVSLKLAEMSHEWVGRCQHPRSLKVNITEHELRAFCDTVHRFYDGVLKHDAVRERSLILSYEDLVSDTQKTFDTRVFPFLGIASYPVKPSLVKQNTRPPDETIENYCEIQHLLKEKWAFMP